MAIYTIGDLHLSFGVDKPMDVFGWGNHSEKIKDNWEKKVSDNDTVILPGDFSWAMYLEESLLDFNFLNNLPGKKILSKGNHDYWWTTVTKMKNFLKDNNFENIDFLYNNSFLVENKIIVGTRGWVTNLKSDENIKILKRENERLKLSITDGINKYGNKSEIIAFIHYPPFSAPEECSFIEILKEYNIKKCFYAHLHGDSHKDAVEGIIDGIEFKLVSSDYLGFDLLNVE